MQPSSKLFFTSCKETCGFFDNLEYRQNKLSSGSLHFCLWIVETATSSQDSAYYNIPDNGDVASTSTSAVKGWTKNLLNEVAEWVGTDLRYSVLFMPKSSVVKSSGPLCLEAGLKEETAIRSKWKQSERLLERTWAMLSLWDLMGCTQRW